jgi:hypothetical protein
MIWLIFEDLFPLGQAAHPENPHLWERELPSVIIGCV